MKTQRAFRVVAVLSTVALFQAVASSVATAGETPSFSRRLPDSVAAHVAMLELFANVYPTARGDGC